MHGVHLHVFHVVHVMNMTHVIHVTHAREVDSMRMPGVRHMPVPQLQGLHKSAPCWQHP